MSAADKLLDDRRSIADNRFTGPALVVDEGDDDIADIADDDPTLGERKLGGKGGTGGVSCAKLGVERFPMEAARGRRGGVATDL